MTDGDPNKSSERDPIDPDLYPTCERCGEQHIRHEASSGAWYGTCTGHRTNGLPCKKYPMKGGRVCERHGGKAPQVMEAATRTRLADNIRKTMASELVRVDPDTMRTDPIQGLLWEVAMSAQAIEWLALQMGDLHVPRPNEAGPLRDLIGVDDDGEPIMAQASGLLWGPDHNLDLATHVLYQMWCEERERHARFCTMAIKAGVSERMVAIAEQQGYQIVSVIIAVIDAFPDATTAQRNAARAMAATKLREIGPAAADAITVG